jgi:hypothetical protein
VVQGITNLAGTMVEVLVEIITLVEVLVRIITMVKVMLANSVAELVMVPKHVELCLISSQVNHLILVCNVSFEGGSIILLIDAMDSLVFLISNNIMVVGMLALPCLPQNLVVLHFGWLIHVLQIT